MSQGLENIDPQQVEIRLLRKEDNAAMARIIRSSLKEFGLDKPGTVYTDPTTDDLHALFQKERARYFIATDNGRIIGGAGVYPSNGLPEDTCEFVKMYLEPDARGIGLGARMIAESIETARSFGYRRVYIETMPELHKAISLYERFGFNRLEAPMGDTGHFGCDVWMLLSL